MSVLWENKDWVIYFYGFVSCFCLASALLVAMTSLLHWFHNQNKQASMRLAVGAIGFFFYCLYNLSFQSLTGSPVAALLPDELKRVLPASSPISLALLTLIIIKSTLITSFRAYSFIHDNAWLPNSLYGVAALSLIGIVFAPDQRTAELIGHWTFLPFLLTYAVLIYHFFDDPRIRYFTAGSLTLICTLITITGWYFNQGLIPWGEPWLLILNLYYGISCFCVSYGVVVYGYSGAVRYQHIRALDKRNIAHKINDALHDDHFHLAYQPKIDLKTGETRSLEALIRWTDPKLGNIPPDEFIPLSEEIDLINRITQWVVARAFADARQLELLGLNLSIAINFSFININSHMIDFMEAKLSEHQLSGSKIIIEITERFWIYDSEEANANIKRLQDLGFTISLDDFGTGESSLQSFHNIQFSEIKIDQSFVRTISTSKHYQSLVQSMIELCQRLQIATVVEGVEDEEALRLVTSYGATYAQGYGIARPVELKQFLESGLYRSASPVTASAMMST